MQIILKDWELLISCIKRCKDFDKMKLLTNKECADFLGVTRSAFARRKDRIYYKIAITLIKATEAELFMNFPRKKAKELKNEILG